jgi:hypothetical protein
MPQVRYFLPDHPTLREVYSKTDLRNLLQSGELSRSDMVCDDETGLAHLLGDLLAMPYRDATTAPARSTTSSVTSDHAPPISHEFRADTPLPTSPTLPELAEDDEEELEEEFVDEAEPEEAISPQTTPLDDAPTNESPETDFLPEEELLLYLGHPSWFSYPKLLLIFLLCLGGGYFCYAKDCGLEWITLLGSIGGLVLLFISLDRGSTTYYVTTRRVEMEFGIVGRNTKEVRISDIRAIDVTQKGFAAILGLGNVDFDSSASSGAEVRFKDVHRPHAIKQLIRELQG